MSAVTGVETQTGSFEAVVEAATSPTALLRTDGTYITVNEAYGELVGVAPAQLIDRVFTTVTYPGDIGAGMALVRELAVGRRTSSRTTKRYVRSDGTLVWADAVMSPLADRTGRTVALLSQVQPVDGPSAEGVTLRESEERFRAAMDNAPIGMAVVGLGGEWLQVNRMLCAALRRTASDFAHLTVRDVTHPDDLRRLEALRRDFLRGRISTARSERRLVDGNGDVVWSDVTVTLVRDGGGQPLHFLLHVVAVATADHCAADFAPTHRLAEVASGTEELLYYRLYLEPEMRFDHVSDSVVALCGYTADEFYADPHLMFDIVSPESSTALLALLSGPENASQEFEFRWRHRDGHEIVTKSRNAPILEDDRVVGLEGVLVDVTRQRAAERSQAESEARFRSLVQNSTDALIVTDAGGTITFATPSVERILGWDIDDAVGASLWDRVHAEDRPVLRRRFKRSTRPFQVRLRTTDGQWRWMEALVTDLLGDPAVAGMVINARDIQDQRAVEEALRDSTVTDVLTRLPNRTMLEDRISRAIAGHRAQPGAFAVLTIDIDRFKRVNDAFGFSAGDRVLVEIAARLAGAVPRADVVGRFAADEFVICAEGLPDAAAALEYAGWIRRAVTGRVATGDSHVAVTVSVGVAVADSETVTAQDLLGRAGLAMRQAKSAGGDTVAVYDPVVGGRVKAWQDREQRLDEVAARGELVTYFQPIVELGSGRPVAAEALVRWDHPTEGLILPSEFIPIAEESGAIIPIGAWVLDDACRRLAGWRTTEQMAGFTVSVNLAARQLADRTVVEVLERTLARHGLPAGALTVEVTESAALGHGHLDVLHDIRSLGVTLALDDFGTHYSSLSYLQRLPVQQLKIDRSFVTGITEDAHRRAIVMATAQLAAGLGLVSVAEGIEEHREVAELARFGIDCGQGYLFGRPMPADDFVSFIDRYESPRG